MPILDHPDTLGSMAEKKPAQRPRMIFDCPERLRRAILFRAARWGVNPSDVVQRILEGELIRELGEADEALASDVPGPPPARRGRKAKPRE